MAANQAVRAALLGLCASRSPSLELVAPPPRLCTDNGVMVAWAAIEKLRLGCSDPVDLPEEPTSFGEEEGGRGDEGSGGEGTRLRRKKKRARDVRPRWPLGGELLPAETS